MIDFFSFEPIKKGFQPVSYPIYVSNATKHTESMYVELSDDTGHKYKHFFFKNAPISSNLMLLLGFDTLTPDDVLNLLIRMLTLFDLVFKHREHNFDITKKELRRFKKDELAALASEILSELKDIFLQVPALAYSFTYFYAMLHNLYVYICAAKKDDDLELAIFKPAYNLNFELIDVSGYYQNALRYAENVFVLPHREGYDVHPRIVAEWFKNYCRGNDETEDADFLNKTTSDPGIPIAQRYGRSVTNMPWQEYLKKMSAMDTEGKRVLSLAQYMNMGFQQLIHDGQSIRLCGLCNRYFKVRASSKQEYCTRIYKDTQFPCNEYASRKSYKLRLGEHPIHKEFTRAYNQLYGRIRRGKQPDGDAVMEQLKALHDDYTERYANTHKKDREAVWKEYIRKNKELLS